MTRTPLAWIAVADPVAAGGHRLKGRGVWVGTLEFRFRGRDTARYGARGTFELKSKDFPDMDPISGRADCLAVSGNLAVLSGSLDAPQRGYFVVIAEDGQESRGPDKLEIRASAFASSPPDCNAELANEVALGGAASRFAIERGKIVLR